MRQAYAAWRQADASGADIEAEMTRAAAEEAYWRHAWDELDQLAPTAGEELALAEARVRLMNREKLIQAIGDALQLVRGSGGAEERLGGAQRTIERVLGLAGGMLEAIVAGLDRTRARAAGCRRALERAGHELELDGGRVEQVEERLFALRAAARKHQVTVDDLPRLRDEMAERLARIDAGAERLTRRPKQRVRPVRHSRACAAELSGAARRRRRACPMP